MPKMRTRRSAAKRFSLTGTGKVKVKRNNLRHILSKMSSGSKRDKRKTAYLDRADMRQAKRMIPYAK